MSTDEYDTDTESEASESDSDRACSNSNYSISSEEDSSGTSDHNDEPADVEPEIPPAMLTRPRPPPLTQISSIAVAIALWNHKNILECISVRPNECTRETREWKSFRDAVLRLIQELPVPSSIADYIRISVNQMEKEIHDWVTYHLRAIFFNDRYDYSLYNHIFDLIWHPNGTINFEGTARNLLSSVWLSDMEKCRLLSTYCLKDDLEKMPAALFSDRFKDYVQFDEYPLISYWNSYFRNMLNLNSAPETLPSNLTMVLHGKVDNWPSKEYFFDLLSWDEQIQCAKTLITEQRLKYQNAILWKLNETQRLQVYIDNAVDIMINYAQPWYNDYNLFHTWLEIRNLISPDQFLSIFKNFLKWRSAHDEALMEIWIEAPDDLKRYVSDFNDHEIIRKLFAFWKDRRKYEFRLDLLFAVLSDTDASVKKKIVERDYFVDFCEHLLENDDTEDFNRLLNLCFPKDQELTKYKLNFAFNSKTVRNYCVALCYKEGKLKKMNDYLNSLMSSNSAAILDYKKKLLMSETGIEVCSHHVCPKKKPDKLREIIADGLPTKDLATEFVKKVLVSRKAISALRKSIENEGLDDVQKYIDNHLESDEDKRTVKKEIIDDETLFLCELLSRYDKSQWKNFIRWALEDDQAVENFKTKLREDAVFDILLKNCIFEEFRFSKSIIKKNITFEALDLFLKWYFVSSAKINSYKWRRIDSWRDIAPIETLLELNTKNNKHLEAVMRWFFGNNIKQIANFKRKFKGERIADIW